MDRALPKKTWTNKRIAAVSGIVVLIALISASYYFTSGNSRVNVDKERISIAEVKNDSFREYIPVNGSILPISTIYLDASIGGRVEEKFVEDGSVMKKGDAIMRLSNTDQELSLVNQETQVNLSYSFALLRYWPLLFITSPFTLSKTFWSIHYQLHFFLLFYFFL